MGNRKTNYITIQIPTKRYLAKFASSIYGNPIPANSNTMLGLLIKVCLEKKLYDNRTSSIYVRKEYNGTLNISITKWQFKMIGFEVYPEKYIAINSFIENIFTEHLYQWCYVHTKKDVRYKGYDEHIRSFAAHHKILLDDAEEDITLESLKKKEYRFRKGKEKNIAEYENLFYAKMSAR